MGEWTTEAREQLSKLYVEINITSDELIKDKDALIGFAASLNSSLSCPNEFTSEQVAGEILRMRKKGKLPRIRS